VATVFVDTGALYALADISDQNHETASNYFQRVAPVGRMLTTDYVFVETWFLIRARLGRPAALKFWDSMTSGVITVVGVSSVDLVRAREIAKAWADQDFSLVDCSSFAVMERLKLSEAFAFDVHFQIYRKSPKRDEAFLVVP
jgi:predicted nucleic acid-binding protein